MTTRYLSQPECASRFRSNTDNLAKMAGITGPSFRCKKCGQHKKVAGRKLATSHRKDGYICKECQS